MHPFTDQCFRQLSENEDEVHPFCADVATKLAERCGLEIKFEAVNGNRPEVPVEQARPPWRDGQVPDHLQKEISSFAYKLDEVLGPAKVIWTGFKAPLSTDVDIQRSVLILAARVATPIYLTRFRSDIANIDSLADSIGHVLIHAAQTFGDELAGLDEQAIIGFLRGQWQTEYGAAVVHRVINDVSRSASQYLANLHRIPSAKERPGHDWPSLVKCVQDINAALKPAELSDSTGDWQLISQTLFACCSRALNMEQQVIREPARYGIRKQGTEAAGATGHSDSNDSSDDGDDSDR